MPPATLRRRRPTFLPPPPLFLRSPTPAFPNAYRHFPRRARPVPCASLTPTDPAPQYVPLHVHSDFSLLDGASQLPNLVARAAELGVPALALTDHGVLYGAIQLVRTCTNSAVKPIIGNEMYIVNSPLDDPAASPPAKGEKPPKRYHLIVLAKNTTGYRNLVKLTTMAHLAGKVGKGIFARPCINKAQLFQHREGLIVSSACLGGEIPQAILNDDLHSARDVAQWYSDTFGDDFYLEIQDHGSAEDKKVNPQMVALSRQLGIKVIATNDSHFTSCLDADAHDALICIQTGKLLSDENRLHYAGNEYFKSVDEMRECFVDHLPIDAVDEALCNTIDVAAKVEKYDLFGATRIPDFPIPQGFTSSHDDYLRHVARQGLSDRLKARQEACLADPAAEEQYHERLELELDMICKMGFSSYFLVVWDYVRHAKDLNIPVGPGRGSAAGSLVAFALRITDVDPIPFNLLFERFLNPERKSMPDIDTDFSVKGREEIIKYVSERYGADRVAQIITFNRLTSKAVLKDVARVHDVPYSEADRLAKLIPVVRGKPATLTKLLSDDTPSPDFKKTVERNPPYKSWIDKAMRIEGANKTYGIHAAGVVISASPLTDIVPLSKAKHGETITQYAMEDVESLGLLKMDFLGLKNLTVIETALEFINEGRRKFGDKNDLDFSVDALPLDDMNTYKLLAEGELDGIFQLDASAGMRKIVRELRPSSLEDISSILALYRPGPLDAGLIPKFIRRKHGQEPIEYDHPLLEPILKETYGIMVYQEQIMRIARDLAGYSLGQADILRRAMGKKKTADMEREKPRFVDGAKQRGVSEEKAVELFDMMIKFAEYCFNKSHSTAYAYLTYQTAYLKANYPVEYSAALLRSNMNQSDKLVRYLADANTSGVRVAPPSVSKSDLGFTVDRSDQKEAVVLFGLEAVKAVGESVSKALLEERNARGPFTNIIDVIERVNLRVLNKRAMGALIQAGAFDEIHPNRKVLLDQLDDLLALRRKLRDRKKRRESKGMTAEEENAAMEADLLAWEEVEMQLARDSETKPDFSLLERLAGEKATLGFYASGHPLYDLQAVAEILGATRVDRVVGDGAESDRLPFEDHSSGVSNALPDGTEVLILSCVTDLKRINTAKGKKMAKWMIEDSTARVAGIVFPGSYDIVEQVHRTEPIDTTAHAAAAASSSIDAEDEGTETRSSLVVKEDARVVVWGKVDRESSGTAQVIIDDVQRVEDVTAVVATARYNAQRSPPDHLQILRYKAAQILEVQLSETGFAQYVDSNGEVRRRRSKAIPLSKKSRVPLILRCLDEAGCVISHMNAGNAVRFPAKGADLLEALRTSTGFEVELLSVSKDILRNDTVTPAAHVEQREGVRAAANIAERFLGDPVDRNERVKGDELQKAALLGDNASGQQVFEEAVEESEIMKHVPAEVRCDSAVEEIGKEDGVAQEREEEEIIYVHGVPLTREEHTDFLASQYITSRNLVNVSMSRQEESLRASIRRRSRVQTSARGTVNGSHQESRTATHDVATINKPLSVVLDRPESSPALSVSVLQESIHATGNAAERREGAVSEDSRGISRNEFSGFSTANEFKDPNVHSVAFVKNKDVDRQWNPDAFVMPSTTHLTRPSESAFESSPGDPVRDVMEDICGALDISGGVTVKFDDFGLAGVLDAVLLVAGDIARRHCRSAFNVCGLSGLDVSKISEANVSLKVSARLSFVNRNVMYVMIDVRETLPSGRRKRVRSFGPVVGVFKADRPSEEVPLKTNKARKEVETAKLKMEKSAVDVSFEELRGRASDAGALSSSSRVKGKIVGSSQADFCATHSIADTAADNSSARDGGEVLSCLSRAARLCVSKAVESEKPTVVSLDGFLVTDPHILTTARTIVVRAHLEGTLLGTCKVQAEATVTSVNGDSTSCKASFRVSSPELKGRNAYTVVVDESPLFRGADVAKWFRESSQCLLA